MMWNLSITISAFLNNFLAKKMYPGKKSVEISLTLFLSNKGNLLKYFSKSLDFLESWISKILPDLLSVIIKAILPLVSLVALNSSQFISFGSVECLKTALVEISFKIRSTTETETSILLAISFSDCFSISSVLICKLVLFEIFLFLSIKEVSAIKVLLQFLQ